MDVNNVNNFAKLARMEQDCFLPFTHNLEMSLNNSLKLIELDDDLISYLDKGGKLQVRGEIDDNLIVCTANKSFEIKEAETSNNLLLLSDSVNLVDLVQKKENGTILLKITAKTQSYLEISPYKPKLARLKELLEGSLYSGLDNNLETKLYKLDDFKYIIQCSDEEMDKGLKVINALEIKGAIRMLDPNYYGQVISHILSLVEENSWPNDSVPLSETLDTLEELFPSDVIRFVFIKMMQEAPTSRDTYGLDRKKVCQFYAEDILRNTKKMDVDTFQQVWKLSVPERIKPEMSYLEGIAIVEENTFKPSPNLTTDPLSALSLTKGTITYLPIHGLPDTLEDRLDALFSVKEEWKIEELVCYLEEFVTAPLNNLKSNNGASATRLQGVETILNKHTRRIFNHSTTGVNGKKMIFYGPKYPNLH